ncbi:MAG: hypothetical protein NUV70_07445 [Caldiserica bacterium]|jgi:HSP20 family molecular chaperone IbpA|nr:hypothetical protein [Caldisericota bacterium]
MRKAGFKPLQFEIGLTSLICVLLMLSLGCLSLGCVSHFFEKKGVEVLKLPPSSHTLAIDTLHGSVSVKSENRSDIKVEWEIWAWGSDAKRNLESSSLITREEGGGQFRIRILLSNPGFQDSNLVLSVPEGVGLLIEAPIIAVQGSFSQVELKAGSRPGKIETARVDLTTKVELFRADFVFENLIMSGDADRMNIKLGSELPDQCNLILQTPLEGSYYDFDVTGPVKLTIPQGATGKISAKTSNGVVKIAVPVAGQAQANNRYFFGFLNGQDKSRSVQIKAWGNISILATP